MKLYVWKCSNAPAHYVLTDDDLEPGYGCPICAIWNWTLVGTITLDQSPT